MKTPLECLAEELGTQPEKLREDALELLYMKIGFKPGDKAIYANHSWEVAEIKKFPHGWMVGIYDEPPGKHVDYINPSNLQKPTKPEKTMKELLGLEDGKKVVWSYSCNDGEGSMWEVGEIGNPDHPCQGEWVKLEDFEHLLSVDRANADLVIQCNRMDSILHNKDEIIQKLKRDVETLTDRRNQLIGEKLEIINALDKLVKMDSHCRESRHPKEDQHASYDPCPIANRYLEAKKEAQKTIDKFIRKPKG